MDDDAFRHEVLRLLTDIRDMLASDRRERAEEHDDIAAKLRDAAAWAPGSPRR